MTMLTVAICAAALLTLAIAKVAADARQPKPVRIAAGSKRGLPRVAAVLVAFAIAALGAAYTYVQA